jgi:hypothetical protein
LLKEIHKDSSSFDPIKKDEISQILLKLQKKENGYSKEKIEALCSAVLQVPKIEPIAIPLIASKPPEKPVLIEFMCDVDYIDDNSSIMISLNRAIAAGSPIITTRALFRGTHLSEKYVVEAENTRDSLLTTIGSNYDIYEKGGYLVFVPKSLEGGSEQKRAEKLDLNLSQSGLKRISLEEAWVQVDEKPDIKVFKELFSNSPTHDKLVYITGHGDIGSPAGMTIENYKEFLGWAKEQHCQGLLMRSCYSGGESTLLHMPQVDSSGHPIKDPGKHSEFIKAEGVPFPVIVRSIGDFTTSTEENTEAETRDILELLSNSRKGTVSNLRESVKNIGEKKKRRTDNLLQVYFPHSPESPGRFRPIGEGGDAYSLTYTHYRESQVESGIRSKHSTHTSEQDISFEKVTNAPSSPKNIVPKNEAIKNKEIVISDKLTVELSPALIESPITFQGSNPIIYSMIPGKAHHLLTQVTLYRSTPENYLHELAEKHKDVGTTKVLFIAALKSSDKQLDQVFINLYTGQCGYREGDQYFLWDAQKNTSPVSVSPLQYFLRWKITSSISVPSALAVRSATGGQQGIDEVEKHLSQETFWGDQQQLVYEIYRKIFHANNMETLRPLIQNLSESEIISVISYLLASNKEDLACTLFKERSLPPDSKEIERNISLLYRAAIHNKVKFCKLLMENEKKVDVNSRDPNDGSTPLSVAISYNYTEILDLLLEQESLDLYSKDERGNPAYVYALWKPELFEKILKKDPQLDLNAQYVTMKKEKKLCLLAAAAFFDRTNSLEFLLDKGADANCTRGDFDPLSAAFIAGIKANIDLLLEHKANPFQNYFGDKSPIVEAMKRSSFEVVEKLFTTFDENTKGMSIKNKEEKLKQLLPYAIASGEEKKINLILERTKSLPSKMTKERKLELCKGIQRLCSFGKTNLLNEIKINFGGKDFDVNWSEKDPDELMLQFKLKLDDPLYTGSDEINVFGEIPSKLFDNLFKKGKGFEKAIDYVTNGISKNDIYIRQNSSEIVEKMFAEDYGFTLEQKQKGFEEIAKSAQSALEDPNSSEESVSTALKILEILVKNGYGFAQAAAGAAQGISSTSITNAENSYKLFQELFEKKQGFEEALKAAKENVINPEFVPHANALKLLILLVNHEKAYNEACEVAKEEMFNKDSALFNEGMELFQSLFEKKQGFDKAAEAAKEGLRSPDYSIRTHSRELFTLLFKYNQGFEVAADVAKDGILSGNNTFCGESMKLIFELFKNNKGFDKAAEMAKKGLLSEEFTTRNSALQIFKNLLENKQGFEKAAEAAELGLKSTENDIRQTSRELVDALLSNNYTFNSEEKK